MSDGSFPKDWKDIPPYIMWGIVMFCTFLLSVEMFAAVLSRKLGELPTAAIFFLLFLVQVGIALISLQVRREAYYHFDAHIDPAKPAASPHLHIINSLETPFTDVRWWVSPASARRNPYPKDNSNPYWSLGLQGSMDTLMCGNFVTGQQLPVEGCEEGWCIESNAQLGHKSIGIVEYIEIRHHEGKTTRLVDVWKQGKARTDMEGNHRDTFRLVYSSPRRRPKQYPRSHNPNNEQYAT